MDERFRHSPSGRLVLGPDGAGAFVPQPLLPDIDYGRHMNSVGDAAAALGVLDGASRRLLNPDLLLAPLRRREALTSSAIENTYSTVEDLALLEADETATARDDTREVWNYGRALEFGIQHLDSGGALGQWLIKAVHQRLMSGLSGQKERDTLPGRYKIQQNFIGGRRGAIRTARFVPTPPGETQTCMDDLERLLSQPTDRRLHPLVEAALVHYQFETIHPFADGNGRVGRILVPLHMYARGVVGAKLLYVSPFIERRKDDYINAMYEVSLTGDWASWIEFFLDSVKQSSASATRVIDRLIDLQALYARRARELGSSANLGKLAELLFQRPVVTTPFVRDHLSVTYRAAAQLIDRLCTANILTELPGRSPKTFIALEVVRLAREEP